MEIMPERRWPEASYRVLRLLEGVSSDIKPYSGVYRSSFAISGFPYCRRIELYCIARRGKEALFIDTGNPDLCGVRALDGVSTILGVPWEASDVFITHFHEDHDGNVPYCVHKGVKRVYSGAVDPANESRMTRFLTYIDSLDDDCEEGRVFFRQQSSEKRSIRASEPVRVPAKTGDVIAVDGHYLEVFETPGHTYNHCCLLDRDRGMLFAGDHVVDAPPGLLQFAPDQHLIVEYLASLTRVRSLDLQVMLMSHHDPIFGSQMIDGFVGMIKDRYVSLMVRTMGYVQDAGRVTVKRASELAASHYEGGLSGFPIDVRLHRMATMFASLEYLLDCGYLERRVDDSGALVYEKSGKGFFVV